MMLMLWAKYEAFRCCKEGATAIEYSLVGAGISIAVTAVLFAMGDQVVALFGNLDDDIGAAAAR